MSDFSNEKMSKKELVNEIIELTEGAYTKEDLQGYSYKELENVFYQFC